MTPLAAAGALARPINRFGSKFMFDPATYVKGGEHGFSGLDFYITGRCGVLGDTDANVVNAALGFFDHTMVSTLWDQGRAVSTPAAAASLFAEVCADYGRDHFGADIDYRRLAELTRQVVSAAPIAAMSLFAGWREMPVPDDAKGAAAHLMNVLRELRGGAHLVAVVSSGLSPLEAVLCNGGIPNAQLFGHSDPYPDVANLDELLADAEQTTDEICALALTTLSDEERDQLVELVTTAYAGLV